MKDPVYAQPTEPSEPRFSKRQFGDFELIALSDGGLNYPARVLLGNVPSEIASKLNLPEKQIFSQYTILLVKAKEGLLLVDVGAVG